MEEFRYKSIRELLKDWPMSEYTEEELEKIEQLAKKRNKKLTIRLWGREYATFYPEGGTIVFEFDEFDENGRLKSPPRNDKGVFYEFELDI
ncbi:MAG: hypothetical protein ACE5J4_03625 [Candidatus Aenigmatarchaeota archaeon]